MEGPHVGSIWSAWTAESRSGGSSENHEIISSRKYKWTAPCREYLISWDHTNLYLPTLGVAKPPELWLRRVWGFSSQEKLHNETAENRLRRSPENHSKRGHFTGLRGPCPGLKGPRPGIRGPCSELRGPINTHLYSSFLDGFNVLFLLAPPAAPC